MRGLVAILGLAAVCWTAAASAQNIKVLPVGKVKEVGGKGPVWWSMAGAKLAYVTQSDRGMSPTTRTMLWDARTTEILSRLNPRLRRSDIRMVSAQDKVLVVVRNYLLLEVTKKDAAGAGKSREQIARGIVSRLRRTLPQIQPRPNRRGA